MTIPVLLELARRRINLSDLDRAIATLLASFRLKSEQIGATK